MKLKLIALLTLSAALWGCGDAPVAPDTVPMAKPPQCSAAGTTGVQICIDGNGNVVKINPVATPTPTPAVVPVCGPAVPLFQENVVQASKNVVSGQTMLSHIAAVSANLRSVGFSVSIGGTLPNDEIALKISDTLSETYDLWRADNTPQVLYQETCTPARFK